MVWFRTNYAIESRRGDTLVQAQGADAPPASTRKLTDIMQSTTASLDAETRQMIEAALNRFVDEAYDPSIRLKRLNGPDPDHRTHWPTLAEMGVFALPLPESLDGIGGSTADVGDALQVLARGLLLEPLIESAVIASAVLRAGERAREMVAQALTGEVLVILVGGRNGDALRCDIRRDGFVVSGTARVVPGAAQADLWLVAAVDEAGVQRVLLVPSRSEGVTMHAFRMMDGRQAADLSFDAMPASIDDLWLEGDEAELALARAAAQAVSAYCADAAGVMRCLVTQTTEYLRTREQFGVIIGSFQALQHRLADMHMSALEARAMARETARAIDAENAERVQWLRYAAPTVIARCGRRVGQEAIQMHGGMGVTDELVISHYNSRLVVLEKLMARWAAGPAAAH
jgi:alkylation response protein AidB-like acyl-CoA dehydrogenase